MEEETIAGVKQAAKYLDVHFNSLHSALKSGILKYVKKKLPSQRNSSILRMQYVFKKSDLDHFLKCRKDRRKIKADESGLYDPEKNRWAPVQAANFLSKLCGGNFPTWRIFYWLRSGKLRGQKHGKLWILKKQDFVNAYTHYKNGIQNKP